MGLPDVKPSLCLMQNSLRRGASFSAMDLKQAEEAEIAGSQIDASVLITMVPALGSLTALTSSEGSSSITSF